MRGRGVGQPRGAAPADTKLKAAISHHQARRLAEAKRLCAEILSQESNNVVALHLLGVIAYQEGDARQATALIGKAIALRPDHADAHNNLGNALKDRGKLDEAVVAYRKALELNPDHAKAHNNLGSALTNQGKLEDAVAAYRKALELKPDYADAHNNLGNARRDQGKLEEAVAAYRKALELQPDYVPAHINLGNALTNQGELEEAVAAYRKALELKPDHADAHYNLGIALKEQGKLDEAVVAYRKALELKPDHAAAHNNLGNALKNQGKLDEAVVAYQRALELKPDHADAHSNLLSCMNYDTQTSQQEILAESRRWDEIHAVPSAADERRHPNNRNADRRLRVGYVSPDFREHSVSYFLDPVIAGHDRRSFEVFCYAEVAKPDNKTARFRGLSDGWCSTVGMTDAAVAERIRADDIDILVDLAGHTANNRLLVFAERPAPVQVTWLGYPNTTGLSAMDYRLTDAIADPEGEADALHTEILVCLPNGFLCYAPVADAPEIGGTPALTTGHVTFGSFNNLAKVTPEVVETWARVLHRIPKSRLVIKSWPLADEEPRKRYLEMFGAHGIDAGRVELCSWIASKSGHLGAYNRVDVGLDPFPYNGTTTTCEALWMGVPVITLRGDRHSGRVGASILTRVNLAGCMAETKAVYVEKAVALANDLDRLSEFREGLRNRMRESPLCDSDAFTRDVEAAYREMWRRRCIDNRRK